MHLLSRPLVTVCKQSLGKGKVFTPVCHSVHRGCVSQHAMGKGVCIPTCTGAGGVSQHAMGWRCLPGGVCLLVQWGVHPSPWVDMPSTHPQGRHTQTYITLPWQTPPEHGMHSWYSASFLFLIFI